MNRTRVAVTIDVENPQTPLLEKRFRDNRIWSNGWGIEKIIQVLDQARVTGDFFVNVYEYTVWGRAEMERVVRTIHQAGHYVHLHTHPIWVDEKRREFMFQLPAWQQDALVEWGCAFIENVTGQRPLAHRAGAYGFNRDTLRACAKAGIPVDSSQLFAHPNCRALVTQNKPVDVDGVREMPVTFFMQQGRVLKTDLDWLPEKDLFGVAEALRQDREHDFFNLCLHSYSFTRSQDDFVTCRPFQQNVDTLTSLLSSFQGRNDYELKSLGEIARQLPKRQDSPPAQPTGRSGHRSGQWRSSPNELASSRAPAATGINVRSAAEKLFTVVHGMDFAGYHPLDAAGEAIRRRIRRELDPSKAKSVIEQAMRDPGGTRGQLGVAPTRHSIAVAGIAEAAELLGSDTAEELYEWLERSAVDTSPGRGWGYAFDRQGRLVLPAGMPDGLVSSAVADAMRVRAWRGDRQAAELHRHAVTFLLEGLNRVDSGGEGQLLSRTMLDFDPCLDVTLAAIEHALRDQEDGGPDRRDHLVSLVRGVIDALRNHAWEQPSECEQTLCRAVRLLRIQRRMPEDYDLALATQEVVQRGTAILGHDTGDCCGLETPAEAAAGLTMLAEMADQQPGIAREAAKCLVNRFLPRDDKLLAWASEDVQLAGRFLVSLARVASSQQFDATSMTGESSEGGR